VKVLIKDNYFENPDSIRELGLSLSDYRVDNELEGPPTGWRGQRSLPLYNLQNKILDEYSQNIFKICYEYFDLKNYVYPYSNSKTKRTVDELTITTYFHITTEETKKAFPDFSQDRFHKDFASPAAGVVYLNPDAPLKAGTSVFDGKNNQMINVENKYNRLVAYDGSRIHALSDTFGDSVESGRMTFTFFIHEKQFVEDFN
jgi:hypothetical protein